MTERFDNIIPTGCKTEVEMKAYEANKEKKRIELHRINAAIPERYRDKTFDTFISRSRYQESLLETARNFSNTVKNQSVKSICNTLILHGFFGSGKTHTGCCIMNDLIACKKDEKFNLPSYFKTRYITSHDLIEDYLKAKAKNVLDYTLDDFKRNWSCYDLVFIDEIGRGMSKEEPEILQYVLALRYDVNESTIIATNLALDDLKNNFLGGYIYSRIGIGAVVFDTSKIPDQRPVYDR